MKSKQLTDEPKKKAVTRHQGITWVSATGVYYEDPEINVKVIRDARLNVFGDDVTNKLLSLIFMEPPMMEVFGPDGEPDQEKARRITLMAEQDLVRWKDKMKIGMDDLCWYGPHILNDVWEWQTVDLGDGTLASECWLTRLKRLPPESFAEPPAHLTLVYSHILQGITIGKDGRVEFWQTDAAVNDGQPTQLDSDSITMITDPTTGELAGRPMFLPIIPLIGAQGFSFNAQMQKVNKLASKPIFIQVENGSDDDIKLAQKIINNWSKDQQFDIPGNFKIIELTGPESDAAIQTMELIWRIILSTITPTSLLGKDGSLIAGSSEAQLNLLFSFIRAKQEVICEGYRRLFQKYLDFNLYTGYTVKVYIPMPSIGKSELWIQQARAGMDARVITKNEFRDLLELAELDEEGMKQLEDEWIDAKRKLTAEWIKSTSEMNPSDPFWLFTPDEIRKMLQVEGKAPELVERPVKTLAPPEEEEEDQEEDEPEDLE